MVPAGFMQLHGSFFDAYTFTLKIAKILSTLEQSSGALLYAGPRGQSYRAMAG
jgi:hypothetical protein